MLIPTRGKLLVKVLSDSRRTESGLYIADTVEEIPHRGEVVSLGSEYIDKKGKSHKWGISPGHIVHFKRNWDGGKENHYILRRDMIYAVECDGKIFAIQDYVIVKRVFTGRIGDSTLVLPQMAAIQSNVEDFHGIVVSVGSEDKMGINIGDVLLYNRNEGLSVKVPLGEQLWSLKPRAILGRIV